MADDGKGQGAAKPVNRFMTSLRDALANAARADAANDVFPAPPRLPVEIGLSAETGPAGLLPLTPMPSTTLSSHSAAPLFTPEAKPMPPNDRPPPSPPPLPSAADAARAARGEDRPRPPQPAIAAKAASADTPTTEPATRMVRREAAAPAADAARTVMVRGKAKVERGAFAQDPVVGWLVVVGGPGLGAYRPIFEGNNTVGRAGTQRVPIDFGDDTISSEEQAYIRYDSSDRSFLLVPNMAKTNVVSVNSKKPTSAVPLTAMDVVSLGRTQLVFVPFCGPDFDWAELADAKA